MEKKAKKKTEMLRCIYLIIPVRMSRRLTRLDFIFFIFVNRSFSLSRNKKIYRKPSSGRSLRSLWRTVSELFAQTFHVPM